MSTTLSIGDKPKKFVALVCLDLAAVPVLKRTFSQHLGRVIFESIEYERNHCDNYKLTEKDKRNLSFVKDQIFKSLEKGKFRPIDIEAVSRAYKVLGELLEEYNEIKSSAQLETNSEVKKSTSQEVKKSTPCLINKQPLDSNQKPEKIHKKSSPEIVVTDFIDNNIDEQMVLDGVKEPIIITQTDKATVENMISCIENLMEFYLAIPSSKQ